MTIKKEIGEMYPEDLEKFLFQRLGRTWDEEVEYYYNLSDVIFPIDVVELQYLSVTSSLLYQNPMRLFVNLRTL